CSLFIVTACTSDGECRKDRAVKLGVDLKQNTWNETSDKYIESNLSSPITVFGIGNDSLIADNKVFTQTLLLPLKNFSDSTEFVFQVQDQTADTVNFIYENEDYFLSFECGSLVFHTLKEVKFSRNYIDSVVVKNDYVAIGNSSANIKIYFKNR
ncbi:MAG: hypothetical protein LBN95_01390, partial [Prevotellaceae bacterium]|nr:hypothetical protein [Prevotellaceae bacterium]